MCTVHLTWMILKTNTVTIPVSQSEGNFGEIEKISATVELKKISTCIY